MLIVDAQVHIWESGTPVSVHRQIPSYTKDDLLKEMNEGGVDGAVLCPPSWDARANEISMEAAKAHPDRLCMMGYFDVADPANRNILEEWKKIPGMLGLRFAFLRKGQEEWLTSGAMDWLWPAAERAGMPIALLVPEHVPLVGKIAERHPGLKLMIDHMARRRHTHDAPAFENLDELLSLAKYPNVAVKATGAPAYSTEPYPYKNLHGYLERIFNAYGPDRTFWGTDITRMPCSWKQCVTMFTEELPWLKGRDLERVMGRALCDWINWKI